MVTGIPVDVLNPPAPPPPVSYEPGLDEPPAPPPPTTSTSTLLGTSDDNCDTSNVPDEVKVCAL